MGDALRKVRRNDRPEDAGGAEDPTTRIGGVFHDACHGGRLWRLPRREDRALSNLDQRER